MSMIDDQDSLQLIKQYIRSIRITLDVVSDPSEDNFIRSCMISPCERFMYLTVGSNSESFQIWDIEGHELIYSISKPKIYDASYSKCGRFAIFRTDSFDLFHIFDIQTRSLVKLDLRYYKPMDNSSLPKIPGTTKCCFSPCGKFLTIFGDSIVIFDIENNYSVKWYLAGCSKYTKDFLWSPCGQYVLATSGGYAYVWKVGGDNVQKQRCDDNSFQSRYAMKYYSGISPSIVLRSIIIKRVFEEIHSCCWSPCSRFIALGPRHVGLRIYDVQDNMKCIKVIKDKRNVIDCSWSPCGRFIAYCYEYNKFLRIARISDGKKIRMFGGDEYHCIWHCSWSSDGKFVVLDDSKKVGICSMMFNDD